MLLLTVKERIEEKNVPSSYRESLERTPSKTTANCRKTGKRQKAIMLQTHALGDGTKPDSYWLNKCLQQLLTELLHEAAVVYFRSTVPVVL